MKRPYEFTTIFRKSGSHEVLSLLLELNSMREVLRNGSPLMDNWLLKGKTRAEAELYQVFDDAGPTTPATAVLTESLKNAIDPRIVSIWNGEDGANGASLQYISRIAPKPSMITLRAKPAAFSKNAEQAILLCQRAIEIFDPHISSLAPTGYHDKKVFNDRPGAGWMLYLPSSLTFEHVPEARALVPVMTTGDKGIRKQTGTIIVSVTDEPFSDENQDHVKIANAIEIRLVDQDLLPRFADL